MIDKETILETVAYMVLTSQNQLLGYSTHLYGTLWITTLMNGESSDSSSNNKCHLKGNSTS